ncbi:MAG: HNH endonuclease [Planctomycetia bacterium]|nr:HNH endonuclease [Planctomycetia bacterium]
MRDAVRERAQHRCEYCHLPQAALPLCPFHVEHIIAQQHGGHDSPDNLALACEQCNLFKGPNLSSIDPRTRQIIVLFHPRHDVWLDHFRLQGAVIVGRTAVGRATARLLQMNRQRRVQFRAALMAAGASFR